MLFHKNFDPIARRKKPRKTYFKRKLAKGKIFGFFQYAATILFYLNINFDKMVDKCTNHFEVCEIAYLIWNYIINFRWRCNICYRVNDLPEEFLYDPVSKSYGDPSRRPECKVRLHIFYGCISRYNIEILCLTINFAKS